MFLITVIVGIVHHATSPLYSQQGCTVVVHNYHHAERGSLDDGADRAHSLRKIHRHYLQPLIQQ